MLVEKIAYKVSLTGDLLIAADSVQEAKEQALTYFAADPYNHMVVSEQTPVLIDVAAAP